MTRDVVEVQHLEALEAHQTCRFVERPPTVVDSELASSHHLQAFLSRRMAARPSQRCKRNPSFMHPCSTSRAQQLDGSWSNSSRSSGSRRNSNKHIQCVLKALIRPSRLNERFFCAWKPTISHSTICPGLVLTVTEKAPSFTAVKVPT